MKMLAKYTKFIHRNRRTPFEQYTKISLSEEGLLPTLIDHEALHNTQYPSPIAQEGIHTHRMVQDRSTQVDESILAREAAKSRAIRGSCPLRRLSHDITLLILKDLDTVSSLSLKLTSKRFFRIITIGTSFRSHHYPTWSFSGVARLVLGVFGTCYSP